jgi:hypothetical protein
MPRFAKKFMLFGISTVAFGLGGGVLVLVAQVAAGLGIPAN